MVAPVTSTIFPRRSFLPLPLEWAALAVARSLYRVRFRGSERIPAGGAILIANHLSYMDVVALQLASPRPLRFVAYAGEGIHPVLQGIFRLAGVIPVRERKPLAAVRAAVRAAASGEIVCLFPEGGISRTGELMEVKEGFAAIARKAKVPVVPAAVDGLWGSIFSFSGQRYLWKWPRIRRTSVFVAIGSPIPAERASADIARRNLLELWAEAFGEREVLERNIGREAVCALAKRPGRVVVIDRTAERREVSAAALIGASAIVARRLKNIPERRIGIVLPPSAGAVIANLAAVCAGKVPVNLNFTASRDSLLSSLRSAGIRTIVTASALREKFPEFPWTETTLDLRSEIAAGGGKKAILPWIAAAWLLPGSWLASLIGVPRKGGREEAALLFTSGSGGDPRGVVLSHRNLIANCEQVSSSAILPKSCSMLGCLPIFHSFGFTVTLWYPLLRGCKVVTVPSPLDSRRILDALREERATVFIGAPTFLRPILKKARPGELRHLELLVAGAEKLPDDLHRAFRDAAHVDILQGYGMTEASPVVSVNQPDPPIPTATADPQTGKRTGTVGRLLPGIAARILDPDSGADLALSQTGMICLKGANLFSGYLDGGSSGKDGWYSTGDLGHYDADGFLTIAGRLSRFSKIGGEMVSHGAIEQGLAEAFGLDQTEAPAVVVVGLPDPAKGELLVLVSTVPLRAEEIRAKLAAKGLPNLWIPRLVAPVDAIPLLGTGKIDLAACRRRAREVADNRA